MSYAVVTSYVGKDLRFEGEFKSVWDACFVGFDNVNNTFRNGYIVDLNTGEEFILEDVWNNRPSYIRYTPFRRSVDDLEHALKIATEALEIIAIEPRNPDDGINHEKHSRVLAQKTLKQLGWLSGGPYEN